MGTGHEPHEMKPGFRLAGCIIGLGLSVGPVSARPGLAQSTQYFVPSLDSIGPGCCIIRIWQSGLQAQGRFRGRPDSESVLLGDCSGPLCEALVDHRLQILPHAVVEMRSGTQAGKGLLIGSLSGAGLLLGLLLTSGCDDCEVGAKEYVAILAVGAAGGGLIGTLVGAFMPNWIPVRH